MRDDAVRPGWYDAIGKRVSRRRFTGERPTDEQFAALQGVAACAAPTFAGSNRSARGAIIEKAPPDLFTGLVGSYGRIDGAPSAAVLVGSDGSDFEIGYLGEAIALEATRVGLDSCWIAGSFDRERAARLVQLSQDEHVPAIIALGIAEERMNAAEKTVRTFVRASSRLSMGTLAPGSASGTWPAWAVAAVEAARRAPSGGNSQVWRFGLSDGGLVMTAGGKRYRTNRMDLGIAMLHVELGAEHTGVCGTWEVSSEPDTAVFTPAT